MSGSIRSGLMVVLAWMAISVCATELMERRSAVLAKIQGAMSHVYEGIVDSDN